MSVLACGDDDGSLGGVPGSKRLADLSDSETIDLCDEVQDRARSDEEATRGLCLVVASASADVSSGFARGGDYVQACQEALDRCLAEPPLKPCEANLIDDSCEATVAEYDECLGVATRAIREIAGLTCEDLAQDPASNDFGIGDSEDERRCNTQFEACFADEGDSAECCNDEDSCDYANDGSCDCPSQAWDTVDCENATDP